jgi:uncharacterized protein (UPF0216 family)
MTTPTTSPGSKDMPIKESGTMEKWINLEFRKLNQSLVRPQPTLFELLSMEVPKAESRDGGEYTFDRDALKRFAEAVPENYHKRLKLPIFFFKDTKVIDSCYLIDNTAVEVLKITGDLNDMYRFREKKLWLGRPLAYEIGNKYPTLVQFVVH